MIFQQLIDEFAQQPRQLFLIDGLGALLSAFLLGVVLVNLESIFGIPRSTLYFLAFLPCVFAAYDAYCYLRIKERLGFYLKGIAYANSLYCLLSIGLACYHRQSLTQWGWGYIILEVIIVITLVNLEFKTAAKLSSV